MSAVIAATGLTHQYGRVTALDDVSTTVPDGTLVGLLGRNGAGKTTFLRLVAGHLQPTRGRVEVFGADPYENDALSGRTCLVRESQPYPNTYRVHHVMRAGALLFPSWDAGLADTLLDRFELPRRAKVRTLSRGMRSAVGCIVGLACRAPLTCFDEPTAGLDPVARGVFYDSLISELAAHPRTVVLSTHLVDEVAPLLEHAVVLHEGKVLLDDDIDSLLGSMLTVTGPAESVQRFVDRRQVVQREQLGPTVRATVTVGRGGGDDPHRHDTAGLEIGRPSLQELVVLATTTVDPDGASTDRSQLAGADGGAR